MIEYNFYNFFDNFIQNYPPVTFDSDGYITQFLKYCQRILPQSFLKFSYIIF